MLLKVMGSPKIHQNGDCRGSRMSRHAGTSATMETSPFTRDSFPLKQMPEPFVFVVRDFPPLIPNAQNG